MLESTFNSEVQKADTRNIFCRLCSDINNFFINTPPIRTFIMLNTPELKERYSSSILQRIKIKVNDYSVLNLHRIGIQVPPQSIYDQLLEWDGHSGYWPNQIAEVCRINGALENIIIYLLGLDQIKLPFFKPFKIPALFNLKAIKFKGNTVSPEMDDARYLLYECSGGYPIGIFCIYVRRPIPELNEKEKSQLFSLVAFNFYGKKNWFYNNVLIKIWEKIHNRVSANILNRMKTTFEEKFQQEMSTSAAEYTASDRYL